jgi:hypothetical protein
LFVFEQGMACFHKVLDADPSNYNAVFNIASAMAFSNDHTAASIKYTEAEQLISETGASQRHITDDN